jgi:hypothetical protein
VGATLKVWAKAAIVLRRQIIPSLPLQDSLWFKDSSVLAVTATIDTLIGSQSPIDSIHSLSSSDLVYAASSFHDGTVRNDKKLCYREKALF